MLAQLVSLAPPLPRSSRIATPPILTAATEATQLPTRATVLSTANKPWPSSRPSSVLPPAPAPVLVARPRQQHPLQRQQAVVVARRSTDSVAARVGVALLAALQELVKLQTLTTRSVYKPSR
jgi:hypothetical protein